MPIVQVLTQWNKTESTNEMAVALDYPASWSDVTGQLDQDIADGLDLLVVQGEVSEEQLAAIRADARYPVISAGDIEQEPADLTAPEVEALRSELAAVVHPDVAKLATKDALNSVTIADALIDAVLRKPWRAGMDVKAGEVYLYERNLYEVIQSHRTQADWHPDRVPALFKRYYEPSDDPWPFVAPTGAHDAYPLGARVLHNGFAWESLVAANVWVPGAVGTEALWRNLTPPPATAEWAVGVAYKVGDIVTYQGITYTCRQAHTSIASWNPPAVLSLWLPT